MTTKDNLNDLVACTAQWLQHQADAYDIRGVDVDQNLLLARASQGKPAPHVVDTLQSIREDLGDCTRCPLCKGRTSIVYGVGNPRARLVFVGEGPGLHEDLQGEPFVGEAGRLLNRMIEAMGLRRADTYIANIVKCRPPRNRDPKPEEVAACEPFLRRQIAAIQPEVLVALGRYAAQTLLQDTTPISRLRGKWRAYDGIRLMPTFHPAYLLRNPADKRLVWADLQEVMTTLGLVRGGKSGDRVDVEDRNRAVRDNTA